MRESRGRHQRPHTVAGFFYVRFENLASYWKIPQRGRSDVAGSARLVRAVGPGGGARRAHEARGRFTKTPLQYSALGAKTHSRCRR
ncbi:hypothetical protein EVAR_9484_1 [Eumeta japonica]|uniref:Uncharacterized protein n=1 Tax=Eumeta variegata TaxID=151549 RepID=A0A4C2A0J6_EUMVA|nr:hypothetical protein EVAR_9484_1 [Eumeta japonica]